MTHLHRAISDISDDRYEPIESRADGFIIQIDPDDLDAVRFERLVARAQAALDERDNETAAKLLQAALELWSSGALERPGTRGRCRAPLRPG